VDVLLPCCGEDLDVIMATVRAACALDYPTSCFRVLVLDDGGSAALKQAVSDLQSQCSHVSYHSRGRQSGMVFAKSGNMNYALTTLQKQDPPEFCAILDADSVPSPDFLRATLPHLLQSPDAALVSTRQYFSNLPNGDPLSQTRSHFYTCQNAALDVLGLAIDAGSGAVFRRSAIVHVGLYPTFSFSEDWQLSQILHGMGWRTFQVQEPLQFGLVPDSLTGHCAQRNRWNIGHAQQIPAMLSSAYKHYTKSLRWSIICDGVGIVAGEAECFFGFLTVPLLFLSGQLIPTAHPSLVKAQILMSICQVAVMWIYEYLQTAINNFQSAPFAHLENKWLAGRKFHFPCLILHKSFISDQLLQRTSSQSCDFTLSRPNPKDLPS
jgi:cellulose synthase/poly-beta-1,6-N-acetylglucosamine synthase-like glycosyltransferase